MHIANYFFIYLFSVHYSLLHVGQPVFHVYLSLAILLDVLLGVIIIRHSSMTERIFVVCVSEVGTLWMEMIVVVFDQYECIWNYSSSSLYARWKCLLPSWKQLSFLTPPGCHRACPSVVLVLATCLTSEYHVIGNAVVDVLQSWCLHCKGISQTHQPWTCCTCEHYMNLFIGAYLLVLSPGCVSWMAEILVYLANFYIKFFFTCHWHSHCWFASFLFVVCASKEGVLLSNICLFFFQF